MPAPYVRVEDAGLVDDGGPVRLVLSGLVDPERLAKELANGGAHGSMQHGRVRAVAQPAEVVDAAVRALGDDAGERVASAIADALDAWLNGAPDVTTPAGPLPTSERPLVMGILNVTPDSFSDGGEHFAAGDHPRRAIAQAEAMLEQGADIIDVGGESTRPGASPVAENEELSRVIPVVEALAAEGAVVSIDTTKSAVARAAVHAGAALVNDVSAGALDGLMYPAVAELGVPYVAMHMRGTPRTMQRDPRYDDVVAEIFDFLAEAVDRQAIAGLDRSLAIVDPGIGFGKTVDHNLSLLRRAREFTSLGRPVLIGTSRKSFIGRLTGEDDPRARIVGSIATVANVVAAGAAILRVHDVRETVDAVTLAHAVATAGDPDPDEG